MYEFPILGQINIYRFVPLDNTYTNTLHFENREAQLAYFGCRDLDTPTAPTADTIMKLQYTQQTYTRNERQYIRIESNANILYDCNYLAYQNRNFGEQWFFAFVTNVEYINDYVTEIEFELDVMQTFMWNYELRECYVVREHCLAKDDVRGKNTQSENNLPEVPMHYSHISRTKLFNSWKYVLYTTYRMDDTGTPQQPQIPWTRTLNNVLMCGDIYIANNAGQMYTALQNIQIKGALDGIMGCIMFPSEFLPEDKEDVGTIHKSFMASKPIDISGYTPKNKKLFNYPFTSLVVDSGVEEKCYKYEYFEDPTTIEFDVYPYINGSPMIKAIPKGYGTNLLDVDITTPRISDISQSCVMTGFPVLGTPTASFDNWFWQNIPSLATTAVGTALIASFVAPPTAIVTSAGLLAGVHLGSKVVSAVNTPASSRLNNTVLADISPRKIDFYFKVAQPTSEGAKILDKYFSMFGYSVNTIKVPNIVNYNACRPNWNYIQATNCNFHWDNRPKGTSVPQKYMRKIISVFEHGVTFWKNPNNVGNYLDDSGNLNSNGEL